MYELEHIGHMTIIRASSLKAVPFIEHAFLGRSGGISAGDFGTLNVSFEVGDDPNNVKSNRSLIAKNFGLLESDFFFLHQIHSNRVILADKRKNHTQAADAVITQEAGIALAIKTADCVPIFLCDVERLAVAAIHAGWRGTVLNIAPNTVLAMEKNFGTERKKIMAAIGPGIRACCYEVDSEIFSLFAPWEGSGALKKEHKCYVDLAQVNMTQLLKCGIKEENISLIELCTSCEKNLFFSYRREQGRTGRQLSFIMIRKITEKEHGGKKNPDH
ncbi:MAG: peptidoglycan editing factor PgeF [Syntrophales bacterium]|nr:peptidoglycan editing factor PgeF [Syntrophales bacterium]